MYTMENLRVGDDEKRGKEKKVHIVAMPYPAHGHIVPLMELCKQLACQEGFMVTFVNTEHNHARMLQAEAAQYEHIINKNTKVNNRNKDNIKDLSNRNKGVPTMGNINNIRLVGIPGGVPPELHGDPAHVVSAFQASESLSGPFDKLLQKLAHEGDPATCIISDVLMSWTQDSADLMGIPRFAFWTSSAAVYHVIWHMYGLISQGIPTFKAANTTFEDSNTEMVSCIPGLPPMNLNDLPIIVRSDPADFIYQFLSRQLRPMKRAAAVLLNTFYELEEDCLQALPATSSVPIYAIGPLLPPNTMELHPHFDYHHDGEGDSDKKLLDGAAAELIISIDSDMKLLDGTAAELIKKPVKAVDNLDPHAPLIPDTQNPAAKSSFKGEGPALSVEHDVRTNSEEREIATTFKHNGPYVARVTAPAAGKARKAPIKAAVKGAGKTGPRDSREGKADGKPTSGGTKSENCGGDTVPEDGGKAGEEPGERKAGKCDGKAVRAGENEGGKPGGTECGGESR
eukprot:c11787_g1_i1 orf=2-1531(-)